MNFRGRAFKSSRRLLARMPGASRVFANSPLVRPVKMPPWFLRLRLPRRQRPNSRGLLLLRCNSVGKRMKQMTVWFRAGGVEAKSLVCAPPVFFVE
jgi:hypothetical protein